MIEYLRFAPVVKNIVSWPQTYPLGLVTLGFRHCKPHERVCQKGMLERERARLEEEGTCFFPSASHSGTAPQHCFFISIQDCLPTAATKSSPTETRAPLNQPPLRGLAPRAITEGTSTSRPLTSDRRLSATGSPLVEIWFNNPNLCPLGHQPKGQ